MDNRGGGVSRIGVNDAKFLRIISVTDQGSEMVSTCGETVGSLPHCLESLPWGRTDRGAEVTGNGTIFGIHKTTTKWLMSLRSTKLSFHLDPLQTPQLFPSYNAPDQGGK